MKYVREDMLVRVLPYIDDFLLASSVGRDSMKEDCMEVSRRLDVVLDGLGLERHESNGVWGRATQG